MAKAFDTDDLEKAEATDFSSLPAKVEENPCVTIFRYRDRWAVCPKAGENYIFPTIGQALNEARTFLTGESE